MFTIKEKLFPLSHIFICLPQKMVVPLSHMFALENGSGPFITYVCHRKRQWSLYHICLPQKMAVVPLLHMFAIKNGSGPFITYVCHRKWPWSLYHICLQQKLAVVSLSHMFAIENGRGSLYHMSVKTVLVKPQDNKFSLNLYHFAFISLIIYLIQIPVTEGAYLFNHKSLPQLCIHDI